MGCHIRCVQLGFSSCELKISTELKKDCCQTASLLDFFNYYYYYYLMVAFSGLGFFAFFPYGITILICYAGITGNSIFYALLMSGLYTEGAFLVYSCRDYWVCRKASLNSTMVSPLTSETYPHAFKSP